MPQIRASLQHYEVSFYSACRTGEFECRTSQPILVYRVYYDYDPSSPQGFVYLPGPHDEALGLNHMWRGHGFDGHWLRATRAWEEFARPIIAIPRAREAGRYH